MNDKYKKARSLFAALSEADQAAVTREYDEKTKTIKEILALYGLEELKPNELYHAFPPLTSPNKKCPYCGAGLIKYRPSRTESYSRPRSWLCPACGHEEDPQCQCSGCRARYQDRKEEAISVKKGIINKMFPPPDTPPRELSELTILDKVSLGTMARIGLSSDWDRIAPFDSQPYPVFPDRKFEDSAVGMLLDQSIISLHPDSDVDAFTFDDGMKNLSYDRRRVSFRPHVVLKGSRKDAMRELLSPEKVSSITPMILLLWRTIVYSEVLDLFNYRMNAYGFQYTVGKETWTFFEWAIEKLAPGELYAVIWSAAKNAAAYSVESKVPKRQAANSVLMRMRSAVDKVIAGEYRRIVYERPHERPQSLVSQYFFNSVLGLCDRYWATAIGQATHE